jgi:hypothetical protein
VNKERLRELRGFERGREIDMTKYCPPIRFGEFDYRFPLLTLRHNCRTAGCHAGYTCAMVEHSRPISGELEMFHIAGNWLALTIEVASWLFTMYSHLSEAVVCKNKEARLRLDVMIDAPEDANVGWLMVELKWRMRLEDPLVELALDVVEELELVGV